MRLMKMGSFTAAAMRGLLFRVGLLVVLASVACRAQDDPDFNDPLTNPDRLPPIVPTTRYFDFNVTKIQYTVNCVTKPIIAVNGMFPGPVMYINEQDNVIVNVTNNSDENITIHFHGTRQYLTPWSDGVAGITMCPLQRGEYFVHNFTAVHEHGTMLWHAHYNWQRATAHGAFIVYPNETYPFPQPDHQETLVLAEWWNEEIQAFEEKSINSGRPFDESDAMTINGHPGPTYNCSEEEEYTTIVAFRDKTYLLRVVNAAVDAHSFFSVANHTMTVVEADGGYVHPFATNIAFLSPGQTINVLITANQPSGQYLIQAQPYGRGFNGYVRPAAVFLYSNESDFDQSGSYNYPFLPLNTDTGTVFAFDSALRSLNPQTMPKNVDRYLNMTLGLSVRPCNTLPDPTTCEAQTAGAVGYRWQANLNNITFEEPSIALLEASYFDELGVFNEDFPNYTKPAYDFTYPAQPPVSDQVSEYNTSIISIDYNTSVQMVFQDTSFMGFESHPMHLHGHNFYILGLGFGNYDAARQTDGLNTYDPPLRNTVSVPRGGWAVIRVLFDNPGMWLFHCHLDKHTAWGMQTVFHVRDGPAGFKTPPPPTHRPSCRAPGPPAPAPAPESGG
ncbi:unnamed protein product [Calypogeia fissa]